MNEIPIANKLMEYQQGLLEDYMRGFDSLEEAFLYQGVQALHRKNISEDSANYMIKSRDKNTGSLVSNLNSWKAVNIKYEHFDQSIKLRCSKIQASRYITANKILRDFGEENCPILNYSCLAPQSVIERHTGIENRKGETVRIHIPLIIPKGDVFFEVYGEEIDWSEIFAFNNQFVHSAHNLTDEYRLVFLLDLKRESVGLPPGEPYNPSLEFGAPKFVRSKKKLSESEP